MRFVLILGLFLNSLLANVFSLEYYEAQTQLLKKFDIQSSYLSDLSFVENKENIKKLHSKTLAHSTKHYYEFIPAIRKIIKENDLPEEFLYLAIVESGLKAKSSSSAKAVGIWQFMEKTALSLNLRVDKYVDERRDPFKSTQAAANYLKDLKSEFGKWYLAILAYNCGSGKLKQAINEAQSDDLAILLDEDKKYLPLETRLFIKKILTLAFLAKNENFLFEQDRAISNLSTVNEFIKVQVPSSVSLKELSLFASLPLDELKRYNPHFRYDFTPPGPNYYMYIPLNKGLDFEKNYDPTKLAKLDIKISDTKIYTVKAGDTLTSIAKKHGITVAELRKHNKIKNDHLSLKQRLAIPSKLAKLELSYTKQNSKDLPKLGKNSKIQKSPPQKSPQTKIYTVKAGDTLTSIAKKHGITVAELRKHNKIKNDHLSLKQKLIIPIKMTKYARVTK
nr:lytic transglycosylase domain-containing protein [Campylobacter troglodytis]